MKSLVVWLCLVVALCCVSVSKACDGYAPVDPAAVAFAPAYASYAPVASVAFAAVGAPVYADYAPAAVVVNRGVVVRRAPLVVVRNRRARVVVVR